jgi:hypothetical protein
MNYKRVSDMSLTKLSAFDYFEKEMRPLVKKSNPSMTPVDVLHEIARLYKEEYWRDEQREKWLKLAKANKNVSDTRKSTLRPRKTV